MNKMKTRIIFIAIICAMGFKLLATTNPQVIVALPAPLITNAADVISAGNDSATIGAVMPYLVNTDPFFKQQPTVFNPSHFTWTWTLGAASIAKLGGGAVSVTDTIVQITMPGTTSNTNSVGVAETSMPKFGTGCTGTAASKTVVVVSKPTFALNAAQNDTISSCSVAVNNNIKFDFTGNGDYYIQYTIKAVAFFTNAPIGTAKTYYAKLAVGQDLNIYADQLAEVAGVASAPVGIYSVKVNGLWDGISIRAINQATLAVTSAATSDLSILVLPAPQTPTIKFIKRF